jgi:hypothetical protein
MGSEAAKEARRRAENYKKALRFIEGLRSFTYEDLVKSMKIAGTEMTESETRQLWNSTEMMIGGPESLKQIQIESLRKGVEVFEEVADKLGG